MSLVNQTTTMFKIFLKKVNQKYIFCCAKKLKSIAWLYAPFYENTCSLDELDEKPNHTNFLKSWNFEGKGCKANIF